MYSSFKFEDGPFEDVSKVKRAFCWKYFLFDHVNHKAKCKVEISAGEYCDRVYSALGGAISGAMKHHLKNHPSLIFSMKSISQN